MATILELVQAACYEGNIAAPSALAAATDLQTLQLKHLVYATARELRAARVWPQLKRRHLFFLESGRSQYPLPADFYATLPGTEYARDHSEPLQPLTDAEWNMRMYGFGTSCIGREFRIWGPESAEGGMFHVSPTPGDGDAGAVLSYEYITQTWLLPAPWVAGAAVTANQLVTGMNGNVYKATVAGSADVVIPSVQEFGIGQDGGVLWQSIDLPMWQENTPYAAGEHVQGVGPTFGHYRAIVSGRSAYTVPASTGPQGMGDTTDGSVTWRYFQFKGWSEEVQFAAGDYGLMPNYFRAVTSGKAGRYRPRWKPSGTTYQQLAADASEVGYTGVIWLYQPAPYTTILADTDVPSFDDELMIAGLKWRFLRARGLKYEDLQAEYEMHKDAAVSRLRPQMKISLSGDMPGYSYPRVPQGSWSLD